MRYARRACLVAALAAGGLAACAVAPPVQEMSDARQAVAAAREAGAAEYAATVLATAEARLAAAEGELRAGAYRPARRSALDAKETAFRALLESRRARDTGTGAPP